MQLLVSNWIDLYRLVAFGQVNGASVEEVERRLWGLRNRNSQFLLSCYSQLNSELGESELSICWNQWSVVERRPLGRLGWGSATVGR